MPAPMRKHHIKNIATVTWHGVRYALPLKVIEKYKVEDDTLSIADVFGDLIGEYGEPGLLLQGLRHRENLNQIEFAKKIAVTQTNLSAMENGRRNIGKTIAKRIAKECAVDYRVFL